MFEQNRSRVTVTRTRMFLKSASIKHEKMCFRCVFSVREFYGRNDEIRDYKTRFLEFFNGC